MSWQIYFSYDEESLATFANAGLIRRAKKGLDEVQPTTIDQQLHFNVEEFLVQLPAQGITQATCTCNVQGCCKHILSSILWLQQNPAHVSAETTTPDAPSDSSFNHTDPISAENAHTINDSDVKQQAKTTNDVASSPSVAKTAQRTALQCALEMDSLSMLKKLRKTERQLALQIWSAWQQDDSLCQIEIKNEKLSFKTPYSDAAIVYFPPADIYGMLSDIPDKHKIACHVACIAYLFQQHAPEKWQWTDDLQSVALAASNQASLSADDIAFIHELKALCLSFIRQGLSHVAKESVMSLHLMNMQARAQSLPRLASELRRLHGLLQRLLNDDVQTDERQIFDALSATYAYLSALEHAAEHPKQLEQLRGQNQREYQQHEIAHLIPLGGEWWTTPSGARGLTLCFWDVEAKQIKEVTQARANALDITFSQQNVAQTGIWGSPIDHLFQHQLHLTTCKITEQGQLSPTTDTRFKTLEKFEQLNPEQFKQHATGIDDWQQLEQLLQPDSSINPKQQRYQLIHVKSCQELELNEVEQRFESWVIDQQQHALQLSISIDPLHQAKIDKLQYQIRTGNIIAILVRTEIQGQHIRFMPCSLILNQSKGLKIFSLDYDHIPYQKQKQTFLQQFTGRIEKLLERKRQIEEMPLPDVISLTLQQTQDVLEFYANTGRQRLDSDDQTRLQQSAQQFSDLGLDVLGGLLKQTTLTEKQLAEKLLQWRHVLLLSQRLMITPPIRQTN